MSTRAPRNGTPSASRRARWRAPLASDPSARTTRCHGSPGSSQACSTVPAKRGAPGDTSPYERTKPGGIARTRARTASARLVTGATSTASAPRYAAAVRRGTYSIVARDPQSGELGVAVQSHWFNVGSVVSWARAGVGAVATQSLVEPAYGPRALALLEDGVGASDALRRLTADDPRSEVRQVAIVDAAGDVAVHTGARCIEFAGDRTGAQFSVQANMMAGPEVWPAMAAAYEASEGPLARRLLAALNGAED